MGVIPTDDGKFETRIFKEAKESRVGVYDSEIEAALAYDITAEAACGDFALLNFPDKWIDENK